MITLGFDSTASVASVSIVKDSKVIVDYNLESQNTHSTTLLPMAEHALKVAGLNFDSIDVLGCAIGPGSFTGLRIGVSTVKGLAYKNNIPCVGISSLEALAYNFYGSGDKYVCPVINARRNRVYTALFEIKDNMFTRIWDDCVIEIDELSKKLEKYTNIYFTGDAYSLTSNFRKTNTPDVLLLQHGSSIALIAEDNFKNSKDNVVSSENLLPVYLQKTQAEREREEKIKKEEVL